PSPPVPTWTFGTNFCALARAAVKTSGCALAKLAMVSSINSNWRNFTVASGPRTPTCFCWPSEMSESLSRSPWPSLRAACAFCTDRCTLISDSTSLDCWSAVALAFSESTRFSWAALSWIKARASCVASCSRRTATSSSGGIAGSPRRTSRIVTQDFSASGRIRRSISPSISGRWLMRSSTLVGRFTVIKIGLPSLSGEGLPFLITLGPGVLEAPSGYISVKGGEGGCDPATLSLPQGANPRHHARRFRWRYLRDNAQFERHVPAFHFYEHRHVG